MGAIKDAWLGGKYPNTPGYRAPGTSQDAARGTAPRAGDLRARVFAELKAAGPSGLTADEVAGRIGKTVLAIRPRVSELNAEDLIEPTGERRANASRMKATVWRVKCAT